MAATMTRSMSVDTAENSRRSRPSRSTRSSRRPERLAPWAHRTPVMTSKALDDRCGCSVFLKCENFQKVGAFKFRGAMNAILQLGDAERRCGVITHSSGNHGQAVALAGRLRDVPVTVVMPRTAPAVKRAATEGYGARIVLCEPTIASREETVAAEIERHGFTLVHPYNDWNVIAGQGTAAWELLDQAEDAGRGDLSGRRRRVARGHGDRRQGAFAADPGVRGRAGQCRRCPAFARSRVDPALR